MKWKAPTVTNGAGVTSYKVTVLSAGRTVKTLTFRRPRSSDTVNGLTNGTAYTFKVAAGNVGRDRRRIHARERRRDVGARRHRPSRPS